MDCKWTEVGVPAVPLAKNERRRRGGCPERALLVCARPAAVLPEWRREPVLPRLLRPLLDALTVRLRPAGGCDVVVRGQFGAGENPPGLK